MIGKIFPELGNLISFHCFPVLVGVWGKGLTLSLLNTSLATSVIFKSHTHMHTLWLP